MKIQKHIPSLLLVSLLASAASLSAQNTYSSSFVPIGNVAPDINTNGNSPDNYNISSTGFTQAYGPDTAQFGHMNFTATGLTLAYSTPTTFPDGDGGTITDQRLVFSNVSDITGSGIQLNRYLSATLGPDNFNGLSGYTGGFNVTLGNFGNRFNTDPGEHWEIRTSIDNFASTLARFDDGGSTATQGADFLASGLTTNANFVFTNGTITSTNAPLELRFYNWYDSVGADGSPALRTENGITTGSWNWTMTYTVTVPEPSGALLLGVAGLLAITRRRRFKSV